MLWLVHFVSLEKKVKKAVEEEKMEFEITTVALEGELTQMLIEESSVVWSAPVYCNRILIPHDSTITYSPLIVFPTPNFPEPTMWKLHLLPHVVTYCKTKKIREKGIGLYVEHLWDPMKPKQPRKITAHYRLSILDAQEGVVITRESGPPRVFAPEKGKNAYGWLAFAPFALVAPHIRNNRLQIKLEIQNISPFPIPIDSPFPNDGALMKEDVSITREGTTVWAGRKIEFAQKSLILQKLILKDPRAKVVDLDTAGTEISEAIKSWREEETLMSALMFMTEGTCDLFETGVHDFDALVPHWEMGVLLKCSSLQKEVLKRMLNGALTPDGKAKDLLKILALFMKHKDVVQKQKGPLARLYNQFQAYMNEHRTRLSYDAEGFTTLLDFTKQEDQAIAMELVGLVANPPLQVDPDEEILEEVLEVKAMASDEPEPMEVDDDDLELWIFQ